MPKDNSHAVDWTGLELRVDEVTVTTLNGPLSTVTVLTDSSGGAVANGTIEVIAAATAASTDTSAASLVSTNAAITAIKAAITELATKLNAVINALN